MSYEYTTNIEKDHEALWKKIILTLKTNTNSILPLTPSKKHLTFYFTKATNEWGCDGEVSLNTNQLVLSIHIGNAQKRNNIISSLNSVLTELGYLRLEEI